MVLKEHCPLLWIRVHLDSAQRTRSACTHSTHQRLLGLVSSTAGKTINLHDQCLPFKKILFIHGAYRERKKFHILIRRPL